MGAQRKWKKSWLDKFRFELLGSEQKAQHWDEQHHEDPHPCQKELSCKKRIKEEQGFVQNSNKRNTYGNEKLFYPEPERRSRRVLHARRGATQEVAAAAVLAEVTAIEAEEIEMG